MSRLINNRYEILRELGRGGFGTVYAVRDAEAVIAMKVFHAPMEEIAAAAVRAEFTALSALRNPNLVAVYDFLTVEADTAGELEGRPFITMELVEGVSLDSAIASVPERLRGYAIEAAAVQLAGALHHVHSYGLIHYDVKPANIATVVRLTEDSVTVMLKLMDFGLAQHAEAGTETPIRGTLAYAAPEILSGGSAGPGVDLFSLGVTLAEVWLGSHPFESGGGDPVALAKAILGSPVPSLEQFEGHRSMLPGMISNLLEKDPAGRCPSARVFLQGFDATPLAESAKRAILRPALNMIEDGDRDHGAGSAEYFEARFRMLFGDGYFPVEFLRKLGDQFGRDRVTLDEICAGVIKYLSLWLLRQPQFPDHSVDDLYRRLRLRFMREFRTRYLSLGSDEKLCFDIGGIFATPRPDRLFIALSASAGLSAPACVAAIGKLVDAGLLERSNVGGVERLLIRQGLMREIIAHEETSATPELRRKVLAELRPQDRQSPLEDLTEAAWQHLELGERAEAASNYVVAAERLVQGGDTDGAITFLRKALDANVDPVAAVGIRSRLGRLLSTENEHREAIEVLQAALVSMPPDHPDRAAAEATLGKSLSRLGEYAPAMEHLLSALGGTADDHETFSIRQEIVALRIAEGSYEEAVTVGLEQRAAAKGLNDPEAAAMTETDLGIAYFSLGRLVEAHESFESALSAHERAGNRKKSIDALINLGILDSEMKRYDDALARWGRALAMMDADGSDHQRAQVHNNIGIAHFNKREYEEANLHYEQARTLFAALGAASGTAFTLTNIGEVCLALGRYDDAFAAWDEALAAYRRMNEPSGILQTILQRADLHRSLGWIQEFKLELNAAERMLETGELGTFRGFVMYLQGMRWSIDGNWNAGHERLCDALAICRESGQFFAGTGNFDGGATQIRLALCENLSHRESPGDAISALRRIDIAELTGRAPLFAAEAYYLHGVLLSSLPGQQGSQAMVKYREGSECIEHEPVNELTWKLALALGREYSRRGNTARAADEFRKAELVIRYFASQFHDENRRQRYIDDMFRAAALTEIGDFHAQRSTRTR